MARRVLFPGRFQPFHNGHLQIVKHLADKFDEVIIVIGSAQEGFTCRNPFTAGERIEMIDETLRTSGISRDKYLLIPVPDIHKPMAWTTYVLGMVPRVEAVATGNPHVEFLYKWIGIDVVKIELYNPHLYSGTVIRRLMMVSDTWRERVPEPVARYIDDIDGVERVKRVCRSAC